MTYEINKWFQSKRNWKRCKGLSFKNRFKKIEALKKLFPASGVDLIDITTGTDYVKSLINFFKTRQNRRWKIYGN